MTKADTAVSRSPEARVIRSAVREFVAHAFDSTVIDDAMRQYADYAAHQDT